MIYNLLYSILLDYHWVYLIQRNVISENVGDLSAKKIGCILARKIVAGS